MNEILSNLGAWALVLFCIWLLTLIPGSRRRDGDDS